jgi:hypothetical protein
MSFEKNGTEKPHFSKGVKGKAIPVQTYTTGPRGSQEVDIPRSLRPSAHEAPGNIPGTDFF